MPTRFGYIVSLIVVALVTHSEVVSTQDTRMPPQLPPSDVAVSQPADSKDFIRIFTALGVPDLGIQKQHNAKKDRADSVQSLFERTNSSPSLPTRSILSSPHSFCKPGSCSKLNSDGAHIGTPSSTDVVYPDYFSEGVSVPPYVPLRSANTPIYVSSTEETQLSIPELWGQDFRSLVNAGGWQNLAAIPEKWKLLPGLLGGGSNEPGPILDKPKTQLLHFDISTEKQRVNDTEELWKAVKDLQLWISCKARSPHSIASLTTCILGVCLVVHLYLLFRLMLLCGRLQHAQRHILSFFQSPPSCSDHSSPQLQGLPSSALLVASHRSNCPGLMEGAALHLPSSSCRYEVNGSSETESNVFCSWRRDCGVSAKKQLAGRCHSVSASGWRSRAVLSFLRSSHTYNGPLQQKPKLVQRAASPRTSVCWAQSEGDVEQQTAEGRALTPHATSEQQQEQLGQLKLEESEVKEHVAGDKYEEESMPCMMAAEECGQLHSEYRTVYMLLCYPGLWRANAYNAYLLESCLRCVPLTSDWPGSARELRHDSKDMTPATVDFCDERQPILDRDAAARLAASYMRERSFAWWEGYVGMCCGCTCCLLILSIYTDIASFPSLDTTAASRIQRLTSSTAGMGLYPRARSHIETASLSSLFHDGGKQCLLSAIGAGVALLQWFSALCLLRACLVDYSENTLHWKSNRSKAKTEAVATALSLLYVFLLIILTPSPVYVSPGPLLPPVYDVAHVTARAPVWRKPQNGLWHGVVFSREAYDYGAQKIRRTAAAAGRTATRYNRALNVAEKGEEITHPEKENITTIGRFTSLLEVAENQHVLAAGQQSAPTHRQSVRNTAGHDMTVAREPTTHLLKNAHRFAETQESAPAPAGMQKRRLSVLIAGETQESSPRVQQRYSIDYGEGTSEYGATNVYGEADQLLFTVGLMLLLICHAVPRLWALSTVLKLIREDDVFIVKRSSRTKPSFTALVWGVGLSMVDLLPLPLLTHFLQLPGTTWDFFPDYGVDLLFCVQGIHVYLIYAHARRQITNSEDSALLKKAISSMQQTFQLHVFSS